MVNNDLLDKLLRHVQSSGNPKAILVDFFDTVVGRTVEPEYVKAIWAKRLKYRLGLGVAVAALHAKRVEVEALLCQANQGRGYDDEFRYLEMAKALYLWLKSQETLPDWCSEPIFTGICEEVELSVEKQCQFLYLETVKLLKHAYQECIPVYLVSDTFLSARQIRDLVDWWGIRPLFRDIFLSSDALLAKRSGRLFERVLKVLQLRGSETLMLGDNPVSDVRNASMHQIPAIQVQHCSPVEKPLGASDCQRKTSAHLKPSSSSQLLFPEFASTLFFFISNLYRRVSHSGVADLLFCSREGLLLKRLFDVYQYSMHGERRVRSHYYYTSRAASFLPSLKALDIESFHTLFRQYRKLSLNQFLLNLQMSETDVLRISQELGQDPYQVIDDFPSSPVFQRLKSLGLFRDIYERSRALQHSYALEYLSSFFPNSSLPSVVALVDIGWKGTIQDNIRAFLPEDCLLQGFYVGLVAPGALSDMNRKEGLLFSSVHKHSLYFEAFAETCPLFEIFLSAQHPGTVSYERSHAGVQPVFGVDDSNDEVRRVINGIQDNIFTTFLEMLGAFAQGHVDEGEFLETVAKRHSRMGLAPSEAELNLVASIEHFENFGLFNHTSFTLPKKVGLRRSARSYLQYVRDPSSVLNSSLWPALSLYREGLSSLLPRYAKRRTKEIFGASGV